MKALKKEKALKEAEKGKLSMKSPEFEYQVRDYTILTVLDNINNSIAIDKKAIETRDNEKAAKFEKDVVYWQNILKNDIEKREAIKTALMRLDTQSTESIKQTIQLSDDDISQISAKIQSKLAEKIVTNLSKKIAYHIGFNMQKQADKC